MHIIVVARVVFSMVNEVDGNCFEGLNVVSFILIKKPVIWTNHRSDINYLIIWSWELLQRKTFDEVSHNFLRFDEVSFCYKEPTDKKI